MKVPRERKGLTRDGHQTSYDTTQSHENDNSAHNSSASMGVRGAVEDLDVGLTCGAVYGVLDVADAETECYDHDPACDAVEDECRHHAKGEHAGRVPRFFCSN